MENRESSSSIFVAKICIEIFCLFAQVQLNNLTRTFSGWFPILIRYAWSKDDFELGGPLGKGKFGRVYVARERRTTFMVAMKIMFKSELTNGRVEKQVLREIEIQSRLK